MTENALVISDDLNKALRAEYGKNATDAQWTIFIEWCKMRRLMPGRDVVLQIHSAAEYDPATQEKKYVKRASYVTTIGALQTIAERSGQYTGRKPTLYAIIDGDKKLLYREEPYIMDGERFFGAKVSVSRKDRPDTSFFARFDAYAALKQDGKPTQMWEKRGPEQTAKCAFAGALREAFPEDLAGVYSDDEMARVTADDEREDLPTPTTFTSTPQVSQEPAKSDGNKEMPQLSDKTTVMTPEHAEATLQSTTMTVDPGTPTEEQLAAREALKKVPADKLAAFDAIVPDAKATFHPAESPKEQTAAPAQPSTTTESQSAPSSAQEPTTAATTPKQLSKDDLNKQYARATKFVEDVLVPEPPKGGGMKSGKGGTVTAKLKKFFLLRTTKGTDLTKLTLEQWEETWKVLESYLKEHGAEKLVAFIEKG